MIISRITTTFVFLSIGFLFISCKESPPQPPQIKTVNYGGNQISENQLESKVVLDAKKTAEAQEISSQTRELKIKVVIDDSFYNKALKEIEWMQILAKFSIADLEILEISPQKVSQWNFSTPEDLVIGIIQKVSKLYEKSFNISLRITELKRVHFKDTNKLLFDYQYMDLLNEQSCSGAEILIGFTAEILFPGEELFTPSNDSKSIIRGTAQSSTDRMFTVLPLLRLAPESFEIIVKNIGHELAHLFGIKHKPDTRYDERAYLKEAAEVIRQNRLKTFTCPEPANTAK